MNAFNKIDAQDGISKLAQIAPDEHLEAEFEDRISGTDDLADYNQNEADDYRNE